MKRLGKVLHVSKRGLLILRTDKTPPIGERSVVMNKQAEKIGTIVDVFGPVNNPYVSIKPLNKEISHKLVGQILYLYKRKK
ncbi:MAG: H/ACA ribonucleoprotein complex subunit GAR1 [Candidatus Thorarchaeota archaeon]